ncbi:MAG: RluA family pseudouridine synthase [Bacteroidales bacterium]|nr:RluA family pseudouridine synthase [Bacteroidales bacterium]
MEVLYEDNHIIAVNKRGSDLVQGDRTGDETLDSKIKEYLRVKYKKPGEAFLGVVHRLDRPVSGVVIYAKTSKALTRLSQMFREKEIKKTYWAIVAEMPPAEEGLLKHFLRKNETQNKSYAWDKEVKGSKEASLSYRIIGRSQRYYLLEVDLHTGRHHQIRCQLAAMGCPVKGDLKYGFARSNEGGSIDLHSRRIAFTHPVTREDIVITAPPPSGAFTKLFGNIKD